MMEKDELLQKIKTGWDDFQAYLATLEEADFTAHTDAAGWTVKDHIAHLALWEDGVVALLHKESRTERMGIDMETFLTRDFDLINASLRQHHVAVPLPEVLDYFETVHQRMLQSIEALSEEDLNRPYSYYGSGASKDNPIYHWIVGDTFEHYAQHQPWIAAIVAGATSEG
jgi:hypothetical protein